MIIEETGQTILRFQQGCQGTVELIAPVVCADDSAPIAVSFFVDETAFPMPPAAGGLYQTSLTPPDALPVAFRVIAQCRAGEETFVSGQIERYDPSGLVVAAETGRPVTGAEVNLHRLPKTLEMRAGITLAPSAEGPTVEK